MNKFEFKNKFSISNNRLYFNGTAIPFEGLEFCKCIGFGANGIVFEVKDINLERKIAVKFWNNRGHSNFKKAQNEAKKLASVDHPYFAKVFSSGVKSGLFYVTMEFVNGVNLKEYLSKEPLTMRQRFSLYWRYSNALEAIYKNEILHGDPHTGNVMVYESSFQTPKPLTSESSYPDALPFNLGFKVLDLGSSSFWEDRAKFKVRENSILLETTARLFSKQKVVEHITIDKNAEPKETLKLLDDLVECYELIEHEKDITQKFYEELDKGGQVNSGFSLSLSRSDISYFLLERPYLNLPHLID